MTLAFVLCGGLSASAQDQKLDVMEIARDTQRLSTEGGELNVIWWLPEEFWTTSIAANANVKPAQIQMFTKFVHPYFIVGVVSGREVYLLFTKSSGTVAFCATLVSASDSVLNGTYSYPVSRLKLGHGLCQTKSYRLRMTKASAAPAPHK